MIIHEDNIGVITHYEGVSFDQTRVANMGELETFPMLCVYYVDGEAYLLYYQEGHADVVLYYLDMLEEGHYDVTFYEERIEIKGESHE